MDAIIEIFTGRLGGGKTYSAVQRLIKLFLRGGIVYTNIKLNHDAINSYFIKKHGLQLDLNRQAVFLSNDQIGEFYKYVTAGQDDVPTMVIIDEAQLFFNSRDWAKTGREVLTFLTQTRKVQVDIILITQHQDNIDKQFRRLVQFYWSFRDMQKFRLPLLGICWPMPHILQVCIDGQDGKTMMSKHFHHKDKDIFSFYESKSLLVDLHLKTLTAEDKPQLSKVSKPFFTPMRLILFALFILLGVYCGYRFLNMSQDMMAPRDVVPAVVAPMSSQQAPTAELPPPPPPSVTASLPKLSDTVTRPLLVSFGIISDVNVPGSYIVSARFNDESFILDGLYYPVEGHPSKAYYNPSSDVLTFMYDSKPYSVKVRGQLRRLERPSGYGGTRSLEVVQ